MEPCIYFVNLEHINSEPTIMQISEKLTRRFEAMETALRATRTVLQDNYDTFGTSKTMRECCRETNLPLDTRFSANVGLQC